MENDLVGSRFAFVDCDLVGSRFAFVEIRREETQERRCFEEMK